MSDNLLYPWSYLGSSVLYCIAFTLFFFQAYFNIKISFKKQWVLFQSGTAEHWRPSLHGGAHKHPCVLAKLRSPLCFAVSKYHQLFTADNVLMGCRCCQTRVTSMTWLSLEITKTRDSSTENNKCVFLTIFCALYLALFVHYFPVRTVMLHWYVHAVCYLEVLGTQR